MAWWNRKPPPTELCCSFCGTPQSQVGQLIAGPAAYICDLCVSRSADIIVDKLGPPTQRRVLGHLSLGVADLDRAASFYGPFLAPLGWVQVWRSERGIGYGPPRGNDRLALFHKPDAPADSLAAGPGFHLALNAPDRPGVDTAHAAGIDNGGRCDGPPGLRAHYSPTYYAAFLFDPDGHKLEVVYQG